MDNISHENRCKSPQQNISKFHPTMYEIIIPNMIQWNLSKGMQGWFNIENQLMLSIASTG